MKRKGISLIELHVEKIVLLVAALVAVGLVSMQFLMHNEVQIAGQQGVRPGEVDTLLEEKARDLQARLADTAGPSAPSPLPLNVLAWAKSRLESPVSPTEFRLAQAAVAPGGSAGAVGGDMLYVEPALAGIGKPWVDQHVDALDPSVVAELPVEFKDAVFGTAPATYDTSWTTPFATIDLSEIRAQLNASDPQGERLSIPPRWYNDRIYVLDVVVERQERLADGSWSAGTPLDVLPLMTTLRPDVERADLTVGEKDHFLAWLDEDPRNQAAIVQPDFYATKGGYWLRPVPPDQVKDVGPAQEWVNRQKERIAVAESRLDGLKAQLARLEQRDEEDQRGGNDSGGGGTGGGSLNPGGGGGGSGGSLNPPGGGGGGSGGDIGGGGSGTGPAEPPAVARVKRQITDTESLIARLRDELTRGAAERGISLDPAVADLIYPDMANDDIVLVWAHDPTVQPGLEYRYRLVVKVYNPFFGRAASLVEEQKDLARSVALAVEPSEWSDPVVVKGHTRFFVTRAQPDKDSGIGVATTQVFRIFDGLWYLQQYDVQPGDPVGQYEGGAAGETGVDFTTGAFVLDILRTPGEGAVGAGAGPSIGRGQGKVVVVLPDGQSVVRDPREDSASTERLLLESNAVGGSRR